MYSNVCSGAYVLKLHHLQASACFPPKEQLLKERAIDQ